ncbi:uncharacterized protein BO97DRAFT_22326 [Aspergillus homomorphus CBS 101889]|uniref:Uncharacterized protein n=1 Tax=Aspergillus homomorphus (strain CBS 101889) TaxID=1450537 RepID=A0A395HI30_ASPHC|nr:hypothetical protein BO97DRAFT_22326 [Aspergillus homomorphus CBS 101889]RAL06638.1 hypothetical protein BO97DRAFT_22326 [Aspergillus homomorphus CBS 101889]
MGITDSKMLAEKVLTACEAAQTQGKCELDVDSFWSDEVVSKVAKKIFQHIPRRIRGTVRQNAAERAAVRSGSKIIIPRVVKDIQANQTRVLEEQGSRQEIYMSILQRGYLQNQSTKHSSLAGCYMLMEDVEKENDVGLIRLRFHCLLFYHLKQYIQPNGFWNDSISFMVEVIGISGLVEDSKDIIREKLVAWTDKGKRYALLARDLGGLGSLLVLPGDIPESV